VRGIAILLVLFWPLHAWAPHPQWMKYSGPFDWLANIGWSGVDLFLFSPVFAACASFSFIASRSGISAPSTSGERREFSDFIICVSSHIYSSVTGD